MKGLEGLPFKSLPRKLSSVVKCRCVGFWDSSHQLAVTYCLFVFLTVPLGWLHVKCLWSSLWKTKISSGWKSPVFLDTPQLKNTFIAFRWDFSEIVEVEMRSVQVRRLAGTWGRFDMWILQKAFCLDGLRVTSDFLNVFTRCLFPLVVEKELTWWVFFSWKTLPVYRLAIRT